MKNLQILFVIAFFAISSTLLAQGPYTVEPSNYLQVSEAIYEDGGNGIQVSLTDIENHLHGVVNANPFDPNKTSPLPVIDEFNSSVIKISWTLDPGADHYDLYYMNLSDGSTGIRTTTGNLVTINNPTPGTYAFTLIMNSYDQLILKQAKGKIIIGKDVMQFILPTGSSCFCPTAGLTPLEDITVNPNVIPSDNLIEFYETFHDPNQGEGEGRYKVLIDLENQTAKEFIMDSESGIQWTADCYTGFPVSETYEGELFELRDLNDQFYGGLYMTNSLDVHVHNTMSTSQNVDRVRIYKCPSERSKSVGDIKKIEAINIFPNPATNQVQINTRSNKLGTLTITNQVGQVIHTIDGAFSTEQINIEEWPKGIYYVTMKIKGETFVESFVKIN